jgi:PKD repeat protein
MRNKIIIKLITIISLSFCTLAFFSVFILPSAETNVAKAVLGAGIATAASDSDGDGITDDIDVCPNSNLLPTITINGCDAGIENRLFADGCTMADLIADCYANSQSHGAFVSCSEHFINDWRGSGLITSAEQRDIKDCIKNSYLQSTEAYISGTVFNDVNGNGKQDDTEAGISGVTVTLDGSSTAVTNGGGQYSFVISQDGTHTLVETDPDGFISTTSNTLSFYIVLGQYFIENFGDTSALTGYASIFGTVFNDTDKDGVQDAGETGIPWVTVALDGTSHIANGFGEYTIQITQTGAYTVTETDPDGAISITPNEVTVDVSLGNSYPVNFADFIESSTTTTISGTSTTTTISGTSTTTTASGSSTTTTASGSSTTTTISGSTSTTIPASSTTTISSTELRADFAGMPTSGAPPLVVQFTNLSSGDITSYLWDFGDMGTSTEENPTHTYLSAGKYTVSLRVKGNGKVDDEVKIGYINTKINGSTTTSTTTTTASGSSTTTTTGGVSTTTTIPMPCSTAAECDDGNFCNGTESCVEGFCVSSGNPCDPEQQICSESLNTCVDIKKIEASTAFFPRRDKRKLRAPMLLPKLSYWLRVNIKAENNADLNSSFTVEGPTQGNIAVTIEHARFRKTHGAFLKKNKDIVFWVPISVAKNATPGTWKIKIETDRSDATDPFIEIVEGSFIIREKLFQK